jgi:elongation factor 1-gamma
MSDKITIHVLPGSSRSTSVLLTATLAKIPFEIKIHNRESLKTEEYLKIHPYGKAPAIQTSEGNIFESNSIARYLARKSNSLYGKNAIEQTQIDQWLDNIRMDIAAQVRIVYAIYGWPCHQASKEDFEHGVAELVKTLKVVDGHLKNHQFLVGNELSIADIALISDLHSSFRFVFTHVERKALVNLSAYFDRIAHLPVFKTVLGNIPHIDERVAIKFCNKKSDKKEEKKCDKKDEKKVEKKKEEKKKEPKEEEEIKEEKPVEYTFPETKFNFFDFKTLYVNEPDKQKALDFLWANWDNNAFSFWKLRYDMLPTEGKVTFLTNNLMNGFLDRADVCRKHTLGAHGVYGDEPKLEIRGVWMWRGTEILPYLNDHPQFEYYERRKLDVTNAEDRALITEYWTKTNEDVDKVEGLTLRAFKIFK